MTNLSIRLTAVLLSALFATSAIAMPGRLGVLPHGTYVCSVPGDATGKAWRELPGQIFEIDNASVYRTNEGSGTYLLADDMVTFTRGPLYGLKFKRISDRGLRMIGSDGKPSRIRCDRRAKTGR